MGTRTKKFLVLGVIILGAATVGVAALNFGYWADQFRYKTGDIPDLQITADTQYMEPNTIVIEKFGLITPVIYVSEANEQAYQEAMEKGVGHYPGTASIGEYGNAYIFGHSSRAPWITSDYNTVFSLLPQLNIDDQVLASDSDGKVHVYLVTKKFVIDPEMTSVLDQYNNEKRIMTLQTSWPLGMTLRRYIVVTEIIL